MFDAKALHAWLEIGRDFTNWIKERVRQYGFTEGLDFVRSPDPASKGRGGHNRKAYRVSLDMAKELAMIERTEREGNLGSQRGSILFARLSRQLGRTLGLGKHPPRFGGL